MPGRGLAEPYMGSRPLSHYWVPGGLPEFVAQGIQAERHIFLVRGVPSIPGPVFAAAACIGGHIQENIHRPLVRIHRFHNHRVLFTIAPLARHNPKLLKVFRKAAALSHPPIVLRRPAQMFGSAAGTTGSGSGSRQVRVQTRTLLYHHVMDEEVQRAKSQGHSLSIARSFAEFR